MRLLVVILTCVLFASLVGCAQTPKKFQFDTPPERVVFPQPPDPPRYRFSGFLYGETNFVAHSENKNYLQKSLAWLVGLALGDEQARRFQRPQTGVVDKNGIVYVTDSAAKGVFVFNAPAGRFEFFEAAGEFQRFVTPVGIAKTRTDSLLVADAELGGIVELDATGEPRGFFGEDVLSRPTGLCIDERSQRIYVSDSSSHQIVVFSAAHELIKKFGKHGVSEGEFNAPTHLACASGKLFVADTLNARVQVFNVDGEFLFTFGKRSLYLGDMPRPKGISVDNAGRIYVVESYYDYLLVYDDQGRPLLPIGGTGSEPGRFDLPAGVWADSGGKIYVADMLNRRVAVFEYIGADAADPDSAAKGAHDAVSGNENHNKPN